MKGLFGLLGLVFVLLCAGHSQAGIREWIDAHPKVAYSIKWEFERKTGPGYYASENAKVSWPKWSEAQKQALEDAFTEAQAWYHSGNPFVNLDEDIEYPPENRLDTSSDGGSPYTNVTQDYAWDMYLRWVAQALLAEYEGHFPWSILDYDTEELKVLLDSTSMFARIQEGLYRMGAGVPGHPNYIRREGNLGDVLVAPPRFTYAFLHNEALIGSTREETIVRLLDWSSANLVHFYGSSDYGNYDAHWHYRGGPPITRIIEGTVRDGEDTPRHWTAGCHGTSGFLRNVLRAANIPVEIANRCGHSLPYFITEGRYLDHADNLYNSTFKSLGLSSESLLIDETTEQLWFGDNPNNNEDYCDDGVGRQVNVLAGTVEVCGDGIDNDDDGKLDCQDSDCFSTAWSYPEKVIAGDAGPAAGFGASLAVSDGTIIAGTFGSNGNAAYVYARGPTGHWRQQAKLTASSPDASFSFGDEVALQGDTAFVTANDTGLVGAVHVFTRSGDSWAEQAILQASDSHEEGRFGDALAIDGNTLVIGGGGHMFSEGGVYVFTGGGGSWQEQQKLVAGDSANDNWFGHSVALEGDLMVIGAPNVSNDEANQGVAYVFRKNGGTWTQEARLEAGDPSRFAYFGTSVAISGGRIMVGAHQDSHDGLTAPGAAYVFDYDSQSGSWGETAKLVSPNEDDFSNFGWKIDFKGDTAVIGAPLENDLVGAAYEFQWDGAEWNSVKTLAAPLGIAWDGLGIAVAYQGDVMVVGADGDPSQGASTGAFYVFDASETQPGQCVSVDADQTGNSQVTLTFSSVVSPGTTEVESTSSAPAVPSGFRVGSPATYYEISTTSAYEGPVQICIDYTGVSYQNESDITMLHYENGAWVDLCADPARCSLDTSKNVVCALSDSLSPFVLAERLLFGDVEVAPGYSTTSATFLAQDFSNVGSQVLLDVYLRSPQPNPWWYGQLQLTATLESVGVFNVDLGTQQLTGLALDAWTTLSFTLPDTLRVKLLQAIAAGRFTATVSTPNAAPYLRLNNLRFAGALVSRPANAARRSSLGDLFSFEAVADWSSSQAMLSLVPSPVTHRDGALRVHRNSTYTPVTSADFFGAELASVGQTLNVDVYVPAGMTWGSVQATMACPYGTNLWLGEQPFAGHAANAYSTFEFALPQAVTDALAVADRACSVSVILNGPTIGDFYLDHLRLE